jgi:regulator of ribonuclease activity A
MSIETVKTTDLCDNFAEQLEIARPIGLRNFGMKKSFFGQIVTVKCFENNPLVGEILQQNGKGKVLVIDGGGSLRRALLGRKMTESAVENGWSGIVVYGCVRDSDDLNQMNIGIKALGTHPLKSFKLKSENDDDFINHPVHFAGVEFRHDEYLYSDCDGIILTKTPLHLDLP